MLPRPSRARRHDQRLTNDRIDPAFPRSRLTAHAEHGQGQAMDETIEAMKTAFAAGISWERNHFVIHGEPSPDDDNRHESTLLAFCMPGRLFEQKTRRFVVEHLKTAFRKGQETEREMRERAKVL
jgi:hypothetical protein